MSDRTTRCSFDADLRGERISDPLSRGTAVFIDAERESWNLDPALVVETIEARAGEGRTPRAIVPVHLYGQVADLDPILDVCERHGVTV